MTTPKCKRCGDPLVKMLNLDKRERGGGRFIWVCANIECERVRDAFDYSHLEVYCKPQAKAETVKVAQ
jgi:RNase P subunit RPR2